MHFSLTFGIKALILVEVTLYKFWTSHYYEDRNLDELHLHQGLLYKVKEHVAQQTTYY